MKDKMENIVLKTLTYFPEHCRPIKIFQHLQRQNESISLDDIRDAVSQLEDYNSEIEILLSK